MPPFFLRNAYITIYPANQTKGIQVGGDPLNPNRIHFDVEKWSNSGEGSTCKIDVYNLSPSQIANLRVQSTVVTLNAGYGANPPALAKGTVYVAPMRLSGSDQVITLDMIEGGLALDTTTVSINLGPNSTNQQAMAIILAQLYNAGLVKGNVLPLPQQTFNNGLHFSGMAKTILARLCHTQNYTFSISSGIIDVVPRNFTAGNPVFLLSPGSGLIDIPTPNIESDGGFTMFEFKSLLNPLLTVNGIVKVQSKYVNNGFYKIFSAKHSGDTLEGADYYTKIQAYNVQGK
jgi:hypothetical protein